MQFLHQGYTIFEFKGKQARSLIGVRNGLLKSKYGTTLLTYLSCLPRGASLVQRVSCGPLPPRNTILSVCVASPNNNGSAIIHPRARRERNIQAQSPHIPGYGAAPLTGIRRAGIAGCTLRATTHTQKPPFYASPPEEATHTQG